MARLPTANATATRLLQVDGQLTEADDLIYGIFVDQSLTGHYDGSLPDLTWNARLVDHETLDGQTIIVGEDRLVIVPMELGRYVLRMTAVERVVDLVTVTTVVSVGSRIENRLTFRAPLQE